METAQLACQMRTATGSRACARLRKTGQVPGIVYGHGEEPVPVSVAEHDLAALVHQGAHLVALDLDGQTHQVLIKAVQFDHLGLRPVHVDLNRVSLDERVTVNVPIELRGEAKGAKEGGIVDQLITDLGIECVVTQIPESIRVHIEHLGIGDALHIRDLPLPEGVQAMMSPDVIVCTVRAPVAAPVAGEAPAEPTTTEPEVIGRREKEPEEAESD